MKKFLSLFLILLIILLICVPKNIVESNSLEYPPIENGKGRLMLTTESMPESITVRKINSDFLFGVGTDLNDSMFLDLPLKGINYFAYPINWGRIEEIPGKYVWSSMKDIDKILNLERKYGAHIEGLHIFWDTTYYWGMVPTFYWGEHFEVQKEKIEKFVKAIVGLNPEIDSWEIGEAYYGYGLGWTKSEIYDVYISISKWIHETNPNAKVIYVTIPVPTYLGHYYNPKEVLDDLFKGGLEADILGIEFYQNSFSGEDLDENGYPTTSCIKRITDEFRVYNKPILYEEIGVSAFVNGKTQYDKQAEWLESFYRFCYNDPDIIGAVWLFIRDDPPLFPYGFANDDYSYRPAATALFNFINECNPIFTFNLDNKNYIDLDPGDYDIMFNNSFKKAKVVEGEVSLIDEISPSIDIISPGDNQSVYEDKISIKGYVSDVGSGISEVKINNEIIKLDEKGNFQIEVKLIQGYNAFSCSVFDNAGNSIIKRFGVIYKDIKQTKISLQIGNSFFSVNNETKTLDSPPIIKNSRTLLPIRAIIEALGGTVGWDPNEKKVTVTLGSTTIELWIGKSIAKVNGVDTPIDSTNSKVVPEIINSRTMLPLRFIAENFGCDVQWDGTTETITITYQQ